MSGSKPTGVRLQRLMAESGIASRRGCEELIESGHVSVNGRIVTRLPVFVDPSADDVVVDGRPLPKPERHLYLMLNKPARTLTTTRDGPGAGAGPGTPAVDARRTVMDLVDHPAKARLFPVGRLDFESTGLILLTNDGDTANRLMHPRHGVPKTYEALIKRALSPEDLASIERSINSGGAARSPIKALRSEAPDDGANHRVQLRLVKHDADRSLVEITLRESRGSQVADVLARLGCPVKRIKRTAIGGLVLKGVAPGEWRELTRAEIAGLRNPRPIRPARQRPEPSPGDRRAPPQGRGSRGAPPRSRA